MSNHYQAINIGEKKEDYTSIMAKRREEREEIERNKPFCERHAIVFQCTFSVIILIILALTAIYVFSILLGTMVIVSNYLFETTMVALYGRATYNKNFPICTNDIYQGSDCYTRTSTYCY
jgi:uncharacterized membrane protein